MQLEQQVVSLDLAKRLKELGVKQESYFRWEEKYHTEESFDNGRSLGKRGVFGDGYHLTQSPSRYTTADVKWNTADLRRLNETSYAAFTVAELGEMLPMCIDYEVSEYGKRSLNLTSGKTIMNGGWYAMYSDPHPANKVPVYAQHADTEADTRAKMLIYLIDNNLLKAD